MLASQALIFSNFKAVDLVKEEIADSCVTVASRALPRSIPPASTIPSSADEEAVEREARRLMEEREEEEEEKEARGVQRRKAKLEGVLSKLNEVGACAELLTCIVANIWDFEKLNHPTGGSSEESATLAEAPVSEVNINESLEQLVEMLKSSPIYKKGVALRTLTDELIPPALWGDRTVFVRGLLNLISNAMKFTEAGHVTVRTCMLSDPSQETVRVRIDVIDTGRGMGEVEMANARKPYVQGRLHGRVSGLGLGLPIVISSIERAGGKFSMSSTIGVGTNCMFELALRRSDPTCPPSAPGKCDKPSRSKTVLVVDDVEMIREGAADLLCGHGHTVLTAEDGETGLALLKEKADELDIALVDIQMPRASGDEVIADYREWEKEHRAGKRRLRVYACTGNATSTDAAAYMLAGFDGCLSKPVYPNVFRALLSDNKGRIQSALIQGCTHTYLPSSSNASSASSPKSPTHTPLQSPVQQGQGHTPMRVRRGGTAAMMAHRDNGAAVEHLNEPTSSFTASRDPIRPCQVKWTARMGGSWESLGGTARTLAEAGRDLVGADQGVPGGGDPLYAPYERRVAADVAFSSAMGSPKGASHPVGAMPMVLEAGESGSQVSAQGSGTRAQGSRLRALGGLVALT